MNTKMRKRLKIMVVCIVFIIGITGILCRNHSVYAAEGIEINETNFPNTVFREYVLKFYDKDKNAILSPNEIKEATFLLLKGEEVSDITGIEHLPFLIEVSLIETSLTEINLSQNVALEYLYCSNNLNLEKPDVSHNTRLKILHCFVDPRTMEGWDENQQK